MLSAAPGGIVQSVTVNPAGMIVVVFDNANVRLGSTYYIDGTVQTNATPARTVQWRHDRNAGIVVPF